MGASKLPSLLLGIREENGASNNLWVFGIWKRYQASDCPSYIQVGQVIFFLFYFIFYCFITSVLMVWYSSQKSLTSRKEEKKLEYYFSEN